MARRASVVDQYTTGIDQPVSSQGGTVSGGVCSTVPADACGSVRLFWMDGYLAGPDQRVPDRSRFVHLYIHIFILLFFDLHDPNPGLVLFGFYSSSSNSSSSSSVTFKVITYTYHRLFHNPNPVAYLVFLGSVVLPVTCHPTYDYIHRDGYQRLR